MFAHRPHDDAQVHATGHLQPRVGDRDQYVGRYVEDVACKDLDFHLSSLGMVSTRLAFHRSGRQGELPVRWPPACSTRHVWWFADYPLRIPTILLSQAMSSRPYDTEAGEFHLPMRHPNLGDLPTTQTRPVRLADTNTVAVAHEADPRMPVVDTAQS